MSDAASGSTSPETLLVHLGDPPSLAAAATVRDAAGLIPWHPLPNGPGGEPRRRAVRLTAAGLGTHPPVFDAAALPEGLPWNPADPVQELALLIRAAVVAGMHGCSTVLWPVQRGQIARDVTEAVERAESLMDAMAVGSEPGRVPAIELPVVDLDDDQILDLIDASGLPFAGAWPCEQAETAACGACRGCRRWGRVARGLGLAWPWGGRTGASGPVDDADGAAGWGVEVLARVRGGRSEAVAGSPADPGPAEGR